MIEALTELTTTHERHYTTRQALEGERIVTITGKFGEMRLRATVTRDTYDHQSHARVYLMTADNGWEYLTGLDILSMDIATRWTSRAIEIGGDSGARWEDDMAGALRELIALGVKVMA